MSDLVLRRSEVRAVVPGLRFMKGPFLLSGTEFFSTISITQEADQDRRDFRNGERTGECALPARKAMGEIAAGKGW